MVSDKEIWEKIKQAYLEAKNDPYRKNLEERFKEDKEFRKKIVQVQKDFLAGKITLEVQTKLNEKLLQESMQKKYK